MSTQSEVNAACHAFIDKLERSAMGGFASHEDTLFQIHRVSVYELLADVLREQIVAGDTSDGARERLDELIRLSQVFTISFDNRHTVEEREMASDELFYWWSVSGNSLMEAKAVGVFPKAAAIIGNPHMHDYFAAGIWDVDFVRQLIAGGVDVELAGSLNPS